MDACIYWDDSNLHQEGCAGQAKVLAVPEIRQAFRSAILCWLVIPDAETAPAIYLIPNGGLIFMITGCFAWASRVVGLAVDISTYHYGNDPSWVGFAAMCQC